MLPGSGPKALQFSLKTLLARFYRRRDSSDDSAQSGGSSIAHKPRIVSTRGIDIDSLEELMNRRLKTLWLRHTTILVILGLFLFFGAVGLTVYLTTKDTVMRIAVGPAGSDDVKFVEKLGQLFQTDHSGFKLVPVIKPDPVTVSDIRGRPEFDLAVVRGNMDLSSDWPVVAILRQDVVALIVPAPSARNPKLAKKDKKGKIEKVADLAGRRIGIVAANDGGPELLSVILKHYGIPADKVQTAIIAPADLKAAVFDNRIDVILVAGPATGRAISEAVVAASHGKDGPSFVPIDQAEGIGKRVPPYDSIDIAAGAFGGVPPEPDDSLTTLDYPIYLVARKTFSEDKIAAFSKVLYTERQALAYQLPGVIAIESPSTDKDAAVLVHNGAAAYLGDNQKTFFDKYGDSIFYGMLILPVVGSGIAGIASYFRADKNTRRIRQLHRLLQLVRKARRTDSIEELEALQDEADNILTETIHQAERGQLDEVGLASFSLAIEQARLAISEQRTVLVIRPENVPHRPPPPKINPPPAPAPAPKTANA